MKKINKYLTILAAGVLAACSSMEVDDEELALDNLPKDFSVQEYVELHPVLLSLQIQDSIKAYNAALTLDPTEVQADYNAYYADLEQLHKIFVDPSLGGFSESDWQDAWKPDTTTKKELVVVSSDTISVKFEKLPKPDSGKPQVTTVYYPELTYNEDGKIIKAVGYSEKDTTKASPLTCEVSDTLALVTVTGSIQVEEIKDSVETVVVTEGGLSKDYIAILDKYNFNNVANDYEALKGIAPDSTAIVGQFIMYGRRVGWAYRKCNSSELENAVLTSNDDAVLGTFYCADGIKVREIK